MFLNFSSLQMDASFLSDNVLVDELCAENFVNQINYLQRVSKILAGKFLNFFIKIFITRSLISDVKLSIFVRRFRREC